MKHFKTRTVTTLIAAFAVVSAVKADDTSRSCSDETSTGFEGWEAWNQITPAPINSIGHGDKWVKIFANDKAVSTYLAAGAPFPECSKLVKPLYSDADAIKVLKLTVMVKMAPGYDPSNGDWFYALYDGPGTKVEKQGKLRVDCIACHKQAAESDYVFSEEVLEANPAQ